MPHTPSPPSSPDSVMIIGNDMQVPISFLRQKAESNRVYDDGGWISWASSPPKPIPALHGPSSLPYARCPSGAEGTIVEGEDLSRMIWGLGIEETSNQPHSRANSVHVSHKSTHQSNFPPRLQAQRNSQHNTVFHPQHNLSPRHQLQTSQDRLHPSSLGGIATVDEARNQILLHQRALESLGPRHSLTQEYVQTPKIPTPGLMSTGRTTIWSISWVHMRDSADWDLIGRKLLGINVKLTRPLEPSRPQSLSSRRHLFSYLHVNKRSSILVSSSNLESHTLSTPLNHRPQSSLPTPPGSSSPQWTPFMPHYTDPFPPLDIHNLPPVKPQPNFVQQPVLQEPQECRLDPSQELRKFVYDQMRSLDRDYTSIDFSDAGRIHQTPPLTPHVPSSPSHYRNPPIDMSPPHPGPPPNSPLPPIPSARTNRARNFLAAAPPSPISPDPRVQNRNLSRQPRSVPFARMLQRRLSSVPEEESGHHMEPCSPPPSPPKTASMTRPPRPPSHSLADSFQSRSHAGSGLGQWHAGPMSPGRNGFAPQTRMSAELESDEARWRVPRASGAKATVKLPLKTTNSDVADGREEGSAKSDGNANETAWEKENGKPRKKVRTKKMKGGHWDHAVEDNVSPWLATSQGPEAWA
ncbi:hypothetical protein MSAN_00048200 [Mycena sanguinolenta]|uniref:Uncharacterized protein n=1 Tax=Mycena sanguinolenta TaxID=230812 RepID=A0A8H6ZF88_9AGAR|nr:hypothetical protein MSAN_00048200 [Mycena sanguinolenta]